MKCSDYLKCDTKRNTIKLMISYNFLNETNVLYIQCIPLVIIIKFIIVLQYLTVQLKKCNNFLHFHESLALSIEIENI